MGTTRRIKRPSSSRWPFYLLVAGHSSVGEHHGQRRVVLPALSLSKGASFQLSTRRAEGLKKNAPKGAFFLESKVQSPKPKAQSEPEDSRMRTFDRQVSSVCPAIAHPNPWSGVLGERRRKLVLSTAKGILPANIKRSLGAVLYWSSKFQGLVFGVNGS